MLDAEGFVVRLDASCDGCRIENNFGDRPSAGTRSHVLVGTAHRAHIRDRGSPENNAAAAVGSIWFRVDGGTGTSFYVKESGTGSTGWIAK